VTATFDKIKDLKEILTKAAKCVFYRSSSMNYLEAMVRTGLEYSWKNSSVLENDFFLENSLNLQK